MALVYRDERLPLQVELGSTGGPEFKTTRPETFAGYTNANIEWPQFRGRWDIGYGPRMADSTVDAVASLDLIRNHFINMYGAAYPFPFRWENDYITVGSSIGTGDAAETLF